MSFVTELYDVRMREIEKARVAFNKAISSRLMLSILDSIDGAKSDLRHQAACLCNQLRVSLSANLDDITQSYSYLFEALDTQPVLMYQRCDSVLAMIRRIEKEFDGMHLEITITPDKITFVVGVTLSENFLRKIHIDG